MIKETHDRPGDTDYSQEFIFKTSGACTIKRIWVDSFDSFWIESNDGQFVLVPKEFRRLISKRMKELTFR